jgi:LuxR family maltose regulon positive regulatory protein
MRGHQDKALIQVIEAMEMAADENLFSYFLYELPYLADVYHAVFKLQAASKTKIPDKFAAHLKLLIERKEKLKKNPVVIDLSSRELDTLKLIAGDFSNQEIADKLFISLNTVKTHIKNIYLKLEADNRVKAIAKARELNLV